MNDGLWFAIVAGGLAVGLTIYSLIWNRREREEARRWMEKYGNDGRYK